VGQSQDNQLLVYSAINRFKVNKKKRFIGHKNAGFACQLAFSPDGKFVMSGDS
jgi:pre-mRNA-processing factor 17